MKTKTSKFPKPLKPGDRVALIAPAGTVSPERLATEIRYLEGLGLRPVTKLPRKADRYLSGSDQQRANEFLEYWHDPRIAGLLSVRGGFGCTRIVEDLQGRLGNKAKLFAGFSDNTVIHQLLAAEGFTGTLHGPHPGSFGKPEHGPTRNRYEAFLFGKVRPGAALGPARLVAGKAPVRLRGKLQGGNLAVLASLCGSSLKPDTGEILFLEDINEQPYRLDAFLTQLKNSRAITRVKAIVLGDFTPPKDAKKFRTQLTALWQAISKDLDVPVFSGFPAGHGKRNLALPMGAQVELSGGRLVLVSYPWSSF